MGFNDPNGTVCLVRRRALFRIFITNLLGSITGAWRVGRF